MEKNYGAQYATKKSSILFPSDKKNSVKLPQVTHISTVHPAFDIRIFYKECRSLAAFGLKVNLVITHDKEEEIDNVKIIPLSKSRNRFARIFIKPFFAFSKALKTKADIFHFHDPELLPVGLLLKLCRKKVIYDVHEDVASDILDKHWIPKSLRFFISRIFRGFEFFSAKFFDGIVTATPHIRDIFTPIKINTIDINNYPIFEENCSLNILNKKKKKNGKIISYVGAISKERGIFELLQAIDGTDIQLHLAGNLSHKDLIKDLESCPGWKNVTYFGQVPRIKVLSILLTSQIGICTLHPTTCFVNSLPIKVFEYMNAGIPIIASNFSYWKKVFKDVDAISFVNPLNPKEIRGALENLLKNEGKCISMGQQGLNAIQKKYNWDIEKEKLFNFYNKLGIS